MTNTDIEENNRVMKEGTTKFFKQHDMTLTKQYDTDFDSSSTKPLKQVGVVPGSRNPYLDETRGLKRNSKARVVKNK